MVRKILQREHLVRLHLTLKSIVYAFSVNLNIDFLYLDQSTSNQQQI